jgi:DNA-binding transcriptional ArsR family regulator
MSADRRATGPEDLLALFTQAAKLLREAVDDAMNKHGVRVGQHIVLSALWERDGLTPGEIARRLGVATPTVVNTATRMEEAGLLTRKPDPADGRVPATWAASAAPTTSSNSCQGGSSAKTPRASPGPPPPGSPTARNRTATQSES